MATRTSTKSDFIRSQPRDISGPEVIKRAAAAGLQISSALVYNVRNHRDEAAPPHAVSTPTESASPTPAEFIRSLPMEVPVPEVIAAGAAQGISVGRSSVYQVRSAMAENKGAPPAPAPAAQPIATAPSNESKFCRLVLELGLGRSKALLAEVERKLESLIAGA